MNSVSLGAFLKQGILVAGSTIKLQQPVWISAQMFESLNVIIEVGVVPLCVLWSHYLVL